MRSLGRSTVRGPLAAHAEGFREELTKLGYAVSSADHHVWLMAQLSRWLDGNGVAPSELTPARVTEFTAAHREAHPRPAGARALAPLLGYLRGLHVVPETAGQPRSAVSELVDLYRSWLIRDRGLAARTVGRYEGSARRFLEIQAAAAGGGCGVEGLSGAQVNAFLLTECSRLAVGSAKGRVAELRCLLRFLHIEGLTPTALGASVPPVAGWRETALPPTLSAAHVGAIVDTCDRSTETGLRDFAILTVLARLGLRSAEIAGLNLEDLHWRAAEIVVRAKARRDDRLPLPADVGEAVAAYLREGRPPTACRAVFLTRYAPLRALHPTTVSHLVVKASRRAGLEPPVAAHRLRHALAAEMLRQGGALSEIAQVLRHRDLATTAVYAKVDHVALRELARPWPVRS